MNCDLLLRPNDGTGNVKSMDWMKNERRLIRDLAAFPLLVIYNKKTTRFNLIIHVNKNSNNMKVSIKRKRSAVAANHLIGCSLKEKYDQSKARTERAK